MKFVFITDLHFNSSSNIRTGDYFQDLISKLNWVVSFCNSKDATLLIGGDIFDKPTVPDFVKSGLIQTLNKLKYKALVIKGNHDELYNNPDFDFRTSFGLLKASGSTIDLNDNDVEYKNCIVTSHVPVLTKNKPQIVLYHGFLNVEDGKNTFHFEDIQTNDKTIICLGHDHVEYDPLNYKSNVLIVRPGSFVRNSREQSHYRQPKIVFIDEDLSVEFVPIETARPYNEIFLLKDKLVSLKERDYNDVIALIQESSKTKLSFLDALAQVADYDVVNFCKNLL